MDSITLGFLIILSMAVILLYLDQFNIVDIAPKSSGFNNPNGYPRDEIIGALTKYKNVPNDLRKNKNPVIIDNRIIDWLTKQDRGIANVYFDSVNPYITDNSNNPYKINPYDPNEDHSIYINTGMIPIKNWAGYKFSSNGRCGPQFGNTACPGTQCCSIYGWCGGEVGKNDDWCSKYKGFNGMFNGKKSSGFNNPQNQHKKNKGALQPPPRR